ncbi:MAG: hypothetical protein ACE5G0_19595 [Rhodothermales bacterium]
MIDQPAAPTLLDHLFDSPEYYLREIDWDRQEAVFLRMNRSSYVRSAFLDVRTLSVDGNGYRLPLAAVLQRFRACAPAPKRLNFIFHTAFCGSTLLSRCLDRPGVCLAYKEPFMIHQLSTAIRRARDVEKAKQKTPLMDVALALLGRTFSPSEIPVIKPTDSCINVARELLTEHPASAGLLLYGALESFLVSMLKRPKRRRYMRDVSWRARKDLDTWGKLPGIHPGTLPDAQAAGFVWLGLMIPYLDLLADERLQVRSLEASVFYEHPGRTLEAVSDLFGLALTKEDIQRALEGVFHRNSKLPHKAFDKAAYTEEQERLVNKLADEIQDGVAWVAEVTRSDPIPDVLPRPLLA